MKKKSPIIYTVIVIILLIIFILIPALTNLLTNWYWFSELGYDILFTKTLLSKIILGAIFGSFSFIFLFINFKIAHIVTKKKKTTELLKENGINISIEKHINKILLIVSVVFGFIFGMAGASSWETILLFLDQTPFNTVDPIFGKDIAYYFFTLPFIQTIISLKFSILIVALIGIAVIYSFQGLIKMPQKVSQSISGMNIKTPENNLSEKDIKPAKIHISILVCFLFVLSAIKIYLVKIPELLYSNTGPFIGAGYTDINAYLPLLKALAVVSIIAVVLVIINIFRKKYKFLFAAVGLYLIVFLVGLIYPAIVQKLIVIPNELDKETPYIANNIEATQKAWAIDNVDNRELSGDKSITIKDINNNKQTIQNIRLWDRQPLLDTFSQIQEIRTYYDFVSIDDDRYHLNGDYRQVMLSPRELNSASLPNPSFINEKLSFTHGFGLTLGPVNEVTSEGLPVLFVKDIPPVSDQKSINVKRPEIYYGELSSDYVFVNTKAQEFDYPKGEDNVFTDYEGSGGVQIGSLLNKALFALKFSSLKILLSNDITNDSRVMYHRDIYERVRKAFPFLEFDGDPYMVVAEDGRLKWIYDAYTESNLYPYSHRVSGNVNYMRNSVKIVIDAYDGKMQSYIADENDPIIQTYAKIFNNIFLPLSDMPEDLKKHVRYPEDIFVYQTELYKTYHMEQPQIFYNQEDQWEIPTIDKRGKKEPIMRHLIMKLPGEKKEEFIFMIPYTPKQKDNMSAWLAARSDGDHYGELVVYRFPKQKLVYGPNQIINRVNQDPNISQQISLWDQRGSEVIQGNLFVIPIEESILYVRPLYLRAEGGKIPELKRVIVVYENQIAMKETLDKALLKIFEGKVEESIKEAKKESPKAAETTDDLIKQAQTHFNNAQKAQQDGNWALYGNEIKKLSEVLEKLNK